MKIVIKIDDEVYEEICDLKDVWEREPQHVIFLAIANGTPLPKGHGRLIDETKITACNWDGKRMCCNAPTAIEADKDGEV